MKIVFFDGYCSLCNSLVDWLIKVDRSGELKFASLQGETAQTVLGQKDQTVDFDTVIYSRDGKTFERSTAVIQILSDMGDVWSLTKIFLVIPQTLRDFVYRLVANNRYRVFKKRETCRMPTPAERSRLLP